MAEYREIGIQWEINGFDIMPKWEREPSLDAITQTLRARIGRDNTYGIKHLWDGVYNKFYSVNFVSNRYVIKLTLPVCPRTKTESEVATMRWTRANTNLPLPSVIDYDSSANNPIGCEWILMTRVEGVPLSSCWREIELGSKERIVRAMAEYATLVWNKQFSGIGNIFPAPLLTSSKKFQVGEVATMRFFWHKGPVIETERGPFTTTREWAFRRLNMAHEQMRERLDEMKTRSRAERERVWRMLNMSGTYSRLWQLYDRLFPSQVVDEDELRSSQTQCTGTETDTSTHTSCHIDDWEPLRPRLQDNICTSQDADPEPTMLWHGHLSADNIMVDPETGLLNGIVDWEDVSCIPLPLACDWPAFIQEGKNRTVEPEVKDYVKWIPDESVAPGHEQRSSQQETRAANRQKDQSRLKVAERASKKKASRHQEPPTADARPKGRWALTMNYWRAYREVELTHLRLLFTQEMQTRCPGWYATWRRSVAHRDFEAAVQHCDNEFMIGRVEAWCAAAEAALDRGAPARPPAVPSLAAAVTQGPDWTGWDDLDDLSPVWMERAREREARLDAWRADVARFEQARADVRSGMARARRAQWDLAAARRVRAECEALRARVLAQNPVLPLGPGASNTMASTSGGLEELLLVDARMSSACERVRVVEQRLAEAEAATKAAREHVASVSEPSPWNRQAWAALEKAAVAAYGENRWWVPKYSKRKRGRSKAQGVGENGSDGDKEDESRVEKEDEGMESSEVSEEE